MERLKLIGAIILLFLILSAAVNSCGGNGSKGSDYPYGYEQCFRCKGSGLVNNGFIDFNTCPVCRGSGMVDSH